jgi:hypothetical protein
MINIVNFIRTLIKWILIILFFPLSLLFVAYFKQRKAKKEYYKDE